MDFSEALDRLKEGERVTRVGWNGEGMFVFIQKKVPGYPPILTLNTGTEVVVWLASQTDLMAEDWESV